MSVPLALVIFDCDGVLVDSERLAVRIDALAGPGTAVFADMRELPALLAG